MAPARGERWILHVDMDAFFAAVEALDDPRLAGRPLIVGGAGPRGVVASCSYEARAFGVRSAMPSSRARRLCPDAVFVAGRYDRYAEVSRQMHDIFRRVTPLVEGISLDEAFLDVTGAMRLLGPAPDIAEALRGDVHRELGLRCSVGVAPVKFLAKLASEAAKPTADMGGRRDGPGVVVIRPGEELGFLHPLPIEALWGVGPATAERLHRLGITTVGDLARLPAGVLEATVGRAQGVHLSRLAWAIDDRSVEPEREVKSVSHEETYPSDRYDHDQLHVELVRMADSVATRLRTAGLAGRTVTLKVRFGDFVTRTRSITSPAGLDSGPHIATLASSLMAAIDLAPGVRLLGVGVSNLASAQSRPPEQLTLDLTAAGAGGATRTVERPDAATGATPAGEHPDAAPRGTPTGEHPDAATGGTLAGEHPDTATAATPPGPGTGVKPRRQRPAGASTAEAVDAIRRRFGTGAVGPATLVGPGGLRVKRPGDTQWGPSGPAPKGSGGSGGSDGSRGSRRSEGSRGSGGPDGSDGSPGSRGSRRSEGSRGPGGPREARADRG